MNKVLVVASLMFVAGGSSGCSIAAVVQADHVIRAPHQFCQELKATASSAGAFSSDANSGASPDKLRGDLYDWQSKLQAADNEAPAAIKSTLDDAVSVVSAFENGSMSAADAQNQASQDENTVNDFYGHNC